MYICIDPYPPPNDVMISELVLEDHLSLQITFEWNAVVSNFCPTLFYIITSNCGVCPNITRSNTADSAIAVTCNNVLIGQLCTLSVRTSVCGSLTGNSISIAVMFDGKICLLPFQYQ